MNTEGTNGEWWRENIVLVKSFCGRIDEELRIMNCMENKKNCLDMIKFDKKQVYV